MDVCLKLVIQERNLRHKKILQAALSQGSQYRIGGYTSLANSMIYFEYQSILVYCFGFTAIFYVCMCVCVYYNKYKSLP